MRVDEWTVRKIWKDLAEELADISLIIGGDKLRFGKGGERYE
jgi:hypothetical protein